MSNNEPLLAGLTCLVLEDEFLIALDLQDILESAGAGAVACHADADEAPTAEIIEDSTDGTDDDDDVCTCYV